MAKIVHHRILLYIGICLALGACASSDVRTLSPTEVRELGLYGVLNDVPRCPIRVENGISKVVGPCEYVTCKESSGSLNCSARKERR